MCGARQESVAQLQKKAVTYFCSKPSNFPDGRPYNCCESVLLTLADYLDVDSQLIPRIGTAIGAGASLNGLLCGTVSSVAMAIGIKYGRSSPEENPQPVWKMMDEYITAFRDKFGHVNCRQLTGCDLKTDEGLERYFADVHDYSCADRLRFAIQKAAEILQA